MNSSSPSSLHLTTSPVRYSLLPLSPLNASGTNLSAVWPARFIYPRPTPAPPMYNSPGTPMPHNSPPSSNTNNSVFAIGPPIECVPVLPARTGLTADQIVVSVGPYMLNIGPEYDCRRSSTTAPG